MQSVTVKDRQTILDVAVLSSGDVAGMFDLALANGLSLTEDLVSGQLIVKGPVIDEEAAGELSSRKARPASCIDATVEGEVLEGIGYWRIGVDFVVQ